MLPLHNYTFLALDAAIIVRLNSVWQFLYQRRPDRLATNPQSTGVTKEVGQVVKPVDVFLELCYF